MALTPGEIGTRLAVVNAGRKLSKGRAMYVARMSPTGQPELVGADPHIFLLRPAPGDLILVGTEAPLVVKCIAHKFFMTEGDESLPAQEAAFPLVIVE